MKLCSILKQLMRLCVFLQLCVILEPMQELMSRHKAYALSPRDCLKTTLFQKWQRMVAPPGKRGRSVLAGSSGDAWGLHAAREVRAPRERSVRPSARHIVNVRLVSSLLLSLSLLALSLKYPGFCPLKRRVHERRECFSLNIRVFMNIETKHSTVITYCVTINSCEPTGSRTPEKGESTRCYTVSPHF